MDKALDSTQSDPAVNSESTSDFVSFELTLLKPPSLLCHLAYHWPVLQLDSSSAVVLIMSLLGSTTALGGKGILIIKSFKATHLKLV